MAIHLDDLIPDGLFVGVSLIIDQGDRFLYGIRPLKYDAGRPALELTGIGGGIEAHDESYTAGAHREAMEEIQSPIFTTSSAKTLIVRDENSIEEIALAGPEKPLAVVFRNYRTPAHRPWHSDNEGEACLLVYRAQLAGQPQTTPEIPNLIWLKPEQIAETARRDVRLVDLLAGGAELVPGGLTLPLDSWGRLTDSQEALAIALGNETTRFFESLLS